jgi:hypothetical protein
MTETPDTATRPRSTSDQEQSKGDVMSKKWIQNAIKKPGQLHRDMGVPQGKKISMKKLKQYAKKKGKVGQRARLAETLKKF